MDTYAADMIELAAKLDLKNAIHVGHSTGGGEVAHYVARAEKGRVAKAVLIGAVPPVMVKSAKNPGGLPLEVFDGRSEEHTSELQSLMRISYAVFCLKKKKQTRKST